MTGFLSIASSTLGASALPIPEGLWRSGRPFIDPMDVHGLWWLTLIPMALFISVAYKAVRVRRVPSASYAKGVALMTVQIVFGMMALAVALHVLVEFIIPVID